MSNCSTEYINYRIVCFSRQKSYENFSYIAYFVKARTNRSIKNYLYSFFHNEKKKIFYVTAKNSKLKVKLYVFYIKKWKKRIRIEFDRIYIYIYVYIYIYIYIANWSIENKIFLLVKQWKIIRHPTDASYQDPFKIK